jgi:hypothetical protein
MARNAAKGFDRVSVTRSYKPAELNQIDPAFARLYLRNPAVRDHESSRDMALGKAGTLANTFQFLAEN